MKKLFKKSEQKKSKKKEKIKRKTPKEITKLIFTTLWSFVDRPKRIRFSSIRESRKSLCDFIIYIIFLSLASVVTQTTTNITMFYFNYAVARQLVHRPCVIEQGMINSYRDINTLDRFWDFVMYTLLPVLDKGDFKVQDPLSVYNATNETTEFEDFECVANRTVLHGNILLGPARLRQVRVSPGQCEENPTFSKYMRTCYAPYSMFTEDKSGYFGDPHVGLWKEGARPIFGNIETYLGAGYIKSFTYNYKSNIALAKYLKEANWIDRGTRLIVIEFSLYHVNTFLFQSTKLWVERAATGGFVPSYTLQTFRRETFFSDTLEMTIIIFSFYFMIIIFSIRDFLMIKRQGFRTYIHQFDNFADFVVYFGAYVMLLVHVAQHFFINSIMKQIRSCNRYTNLDWVCSISMIYNNLAGFVIFFVWIRLLSFFVFNRTMVVFIKVIQQLVYEMIGFILMFSAIMIAFAQCGMSYFGDNDEQFITFGTSILTMVRWVVGDFCFDDLKKRNELKAWIYYLTFLITVYTMLIFAFLAVVNSTYDAVKSYAQTRPSKLGLALVILFHKVYDVFYLIFRGKRKLRVQHDEDVKGELEYDQRIDPKIAANIAAQRRHALQHPVLLTQDEYLPDRMLRAGRRVKALEEVTGPVLNRLLEYQNKLRRQQGLEEIDFEIVMPEQRFYI